VHGREDEAFYLLEGDLEFSCAGEVARASAGDFVYLPRGFVHSVRNVGLMPARMQILVTPGGFERFFLDAGQPARPGEPAPPADPAEFGGVGALSVELGSDLGTAG
jgi:hypothetical protein